MAILKIAKVLQHIGSKIISVLKREVEGVATSQQNVTNKLACAFALPG